MLLAHLIDVPKSTIFFSQNYQSVKIIAILKYCLHLGRHWNFHDILRKKNFPCLKLLQSQQPQWPQWPLQPHFIKTFYLSLWLSWIIPSTQMANNSPYLPFWKLVDETQILKPLEPIMHRNSIKLLILLLVRADLLCSLQCEIPCITFFQNFDEKAGNFKPYNCFRSSICMYAA